MKSEGDVHGDQHPQKIALRTQRERVLERLSDGFVRDELALDEFERRVDRAYDAADVAALAPLIVDLEPTLAQSLAHLPVTTNEALPRAAEAPLALAARPAPAPRNLAIFGNLERSGHFVVPDGMRALAVFGNIEIDLRSATLAPGVTTLHVRAVFGNIELTLPPDLPVECVGIGILGSFAGISRLPAEGNAPRLLRIVGEAVFGNVEVHTRPRAAAPRLRLPER
ncbi:MAG TPA: LiaF domain-containing protein [Polyangiaceae bacterium]|nr:LiaF domain-containing protein [Polyangiaceae bacterium]